MGSPMPLSWGHKESVMKTIEIQILKIIETALAKNGMARAVNDIVRMMDEVEYEGVRHALNIMARIDFPGAIRVSDYFGRVKGWDGWRQFGDEVPSPLREMAFLHKPGCRLISISNERQSCDCGAAAAEDAEAP